MGFTTHFLVLDARVKTAYQVPGFRVTAFPLPVNRENGFFVPIMMLSNEREAASPNRISLFGGLCYSYRYQN